MPGEDVWRIVWLNPVGDSISTMTARRVGDEIVQDGIDDDGGAYRWVFSEIGPDRFRWRSEDRGADGSWTLRQEMVVTRKP